MVFLSPSSDTKIQSRTDSRMVAISSSGPCKSEDDSKKIPFFPGRVDAPTLLVVVVVVMMLLLLLLLLLLVEVLIVNDDAAEESKKEEEGALPP
jgi:hypothetical protein